MKVVLRADIGIDSVLCFEYNVEFIIAKSRQSRNFEDSIAALLAWGNIQLVTVLEHTWSPSTHIQVVAPLGYTLNLYLINNMKMLTIKRNILCVIYLRVHKNVKEDMSYNYIFTLYFYKLEQIANIKI